MAEASHVDGSTAAGSAVSVGGASASGTPTLSGIGTVNGAVTINAASGGAAGTLNPGAVGAIGTLTTGAATINGTLAIDIDAGTADQLVVTGNLDLTGSTLAVNELAVPAAAPLHHRHLHRNAHRHLRRPAVRIHRQLRQR